MAAVNGTSMIPRLSSAFDQCADALDRDRQAEATPTASALLRADRFKLGQRPVDFGRSRHRIEGDVGLGERHRLAVRRLTADAARRGAVVEIAEPAFGDLPHASAA